MPKVQIEYHKIKFIEEIFETKDKISATRA